MALTELQDGAQGADVRIAQQLLNDALHRRPGLAPDGVYGPLTHSTVAAFQRQRNLEPDGVVGAQTWAALMGPGGGPSHAGGAAKPGPAGAGGGSAARSPATAPAGSSQAPAAAPAATGALPPELRALDPAAEPAWLKVALAEYGIHERTTLGSRRIVEYHQATTLHAQSDQVAWCSSFVNWCLQQVGITGTRSAAAASWANWGQGLTTPKLGCIVQLHHETKGYTRATGTSSGNHVSFFIKQDGAHIYLLGGNQSDSVKLTAFPLSKWTVKAYRWPGGGR